MPELPEVETIKNDLARVIIGQEISNLEIGAPKIFQWGGWSKKDLVGVKIKALWRRGKILVFELSNNLSLVFHLKLTGQLIYQNKERIAGGHPIPPLNLPVPNKTTHVIFSFATGTKLYFNDLRKFGWIKLLPVDEVKNLPAIREFGPEPFSADFTPKYLEEILKKKKNLPIKQILMDQKLIAGIGNIYAAESLFLAKIRPQRKAGQISVEEVGKLYQSIKKALEVAIAHKGSSSATFVGGTGERGLYLDYANVYNREGQPCKVCKTPIAKEKLAGRGTYFCPSCQR